MTDIDLATAKFEELFGKRPTVGVFAPGRVNLIGEHTDYNDGFVFPFALPFRTVIVGSRTDRKDNTCRIYSCTIAGSEAGPIEFTADKQLAKSSPQWVNYFTGVVYQYLLDLPSDVSFDAVITSDVPLGSGLSSSASFEVATATFLEELYGISSLSKVTKALRCQQAEHTFAGTPCGIMDQFISALGSQGSALLIDCRSQVGTLIPFGAGANSPVVLITNSNVKHELTGSEYPDRVRQCREAVSVINAKQSKVTALRDVSLTQLSAAMDAMDEVVYSRALHVITENDRTEAAAAALKAGNWEEVGRLMTESHISLQKNYNVSCDELDVLVNLAVPFRGVYGSRMTGGGFGGCTVTLVEKSAVESLKAYIDAEYVKITGKRCSFYVCEPAAGAGRLELPSPKPASNNTDSATNEQLASVAPVQRDCQGSSPSCSNASPNSCAGCNCATHWYAAVGILALAVGVAFILHKH